MGIEANIAHLLVREHAYKPIGGDVMLLGRQTMFFTPEHALLMLKDCGLTPPPAIEFESERRTRLSGSSFISDTDFFRLLGVPKIRALDVSDYEGADIVCDLSEPLNPSLEQSADFILDGSTLDNVFDPAMVLRNMARLLKTGARLFSANVGSSTVGLAPYTIPTTNWLLDYFVVNAFVDCKVYVMAYVPGGVNFFCHDLSKLGAGIMQCNNFITDGVFALIVIAEKGPNSTWDKSPVQHPYRGADQWREFSDNLRRLKGSSRPQLARSNRDCVIDPGEGFFYLDQDGVERKPSMPVVPAKSIYRRLLHRVSGKALRNRQFQFLRGRG